MYGKALTSSRTEGERPSAVILSDVRLYREGVEAGIARLGDFSVVAACPARDMLAAIAEHRPDILLIDASIGGLATAVAEARGSCAALRFVAFGVKCEEDGLAAARAGLTAFVDHEGTIEELNNAACEAMAGRPSCPVAFAAGLLDRLARGFAFRPEASAQPLTRREQAIARLASQGLSNKEIASTLQISPATVKNHVHVILDKLGVPSRRMITLEPTGA